MTGLTTTACGSAGLTLVGEANPLSDDQRHALLPLPAGCAGDRLRRLAGMSRIEYLRTFQRVNLCGRRWDPREARRRAGELRSDPCTLVLLGRRVARAFDVDGPFLTTVTAGLCTLHLLPHPSGLNRWWNDPGNAALAREFLAEVVLSGSHPDTPGIAPGEAADVRRSIVSPPPALPGTLR
jgi:hypothetical protein